MAYTVLSIRNIAARESHGLRKHIVRRAAVGVAP